MGSIKKLQRLADELEKNKSDNGAPSDDLISQIGEDEGFVGKLRHMAHKNPLAAISALLIIIFVLAAICAPVLTPYSYEAQDVLNRVAHPSKEHLLGTDELGRDVFTRLLYGARVSLAIGVVPTIVSMILGAVLGMISGFLGGLIDTLIMRFADIMLAFPSLLLAMVIMYTLGDGITSIFVALAIVNWASVARVVRAETLSLKEAEYVEAARSIGVSKLTIIFRHILPNCIPSLIVLFTLNIPSAILAESSLSFLGIGVQPPASSWGVMANAGSQFLYTAPMLSLAPSIAIMLVVLAFNFLGDGLRDTLDPHLKNM